MSKHAKKILKERWLVIAVTYDGKGQNKGPFTYREYLRYMAKRDSWGDEIVLFALVQEWKATIMVVNGWDLFD